MGNSYIPPFNNLYRRKQFFLRPGRSDSEKRWSRPCALGGLVLMHVSFSNQMLGGKLVRFQCYLVLAVRHVFQSASCSSSVGAQREVAFISAVNYSVHFKWLCISPNGRWSFSSPSSASVCAFPLGILHTQPVFT